MKSFLLPFCLSLAAGSVFAHGLIRNELWIIRDAGQLRMKVAATLDEVLLAQGLHADHEKALEASQLKSALETHADYLKSHLAITDAAGKTVPLSLVKFEAAPALASQMSAAAPTAESGSVAVDQPPQHLNPETTRVSYDYQLRIESSPSRVPGDGRKLGIQFHSTNLFSMV